MGEDRELRPLTLTMRQAAKFYLVVHAPAAKPEAVDALEALLDTVARRSREFGQRETAAKA